MADSERGANKQSIDLTEVDKKEFNDAANELFQKIQQIEQPNYKNIIIPTFKLISPDEKEIKLEIKRFMANASRELFKQNGVKEEISKELLRGDSSGTFLITLTKCSKIKLGDDLSVVIQFNGSFDKKPSLSCFACDPLTSISLSDIPSKIPLKKPGNKIIYAQKADFFAILKTVETMAKREGLIKPQILKNISKN